jgi:hypothetical protein
MRSPTASPGKEEISRETAAGKAGIRKDSWEIFDRAIRFTVCLFPSFTFTLQKCHHVIQSLVQSKQTGSTASDGLEVDMNSEVIAQNENICQD